MLFVPFGAVVRKNSIASAPFSGKRILKPKVVTSSSKNANATIDDPLLERDIKVLCISYLKGVFIIDFVANVPIFVFELFLGWPLSEDDMEKLTNNGIYRILMILKLLRYFQTGNVSVAIARVFAYLSEIFYLHKILFENLYSWVKSVTKLTLIMHIFGCFWLFIHD